MSTGYYRMGGCVEGKVMPRMTFAGIMQLGRSSVDPVEEAPMPPRVELTLTQNEKIVAAVGVPQKRTIARQQGYTGDSCQTCNSMKVKISGHCTVCEECGSSSGCS